jgi:hypothetical protein
MHLTGSADDDLLILVEVLSALALGGCGMIWLTGDRRLRTSVRQKLKERGGYYRLVRYPFTDGPGGGTAYVLLAAVLMAGGVGLGLAAGVHYSDGVMFVPTILVVAYAPYLSSCVWVINRLLPARFRTAVVRRGVMCGLMVCHGLIAILWLSAHLGSGGHLNVEAWNPAAGLFPLLYMPAALDDGAQPMVLLAGLSIVFLVGLVPHLVVSLMRLSKHLDGEYD